MPFGFCLLFIFVFMYFYVCMKGLIRLFFNDSWLDFNIIVDVLFFFIWPVGHWELSDCGGVEK